MFDVGVTSMLDKDVVRTIVIIFLLMMFVVLLYAFIRTAIEHAVSSVRKFFAKYTFISSMALAVVTLPLYLYIYFSLHNYFKVITRFFTLVYFGILGVAIIKLTFFLAQEFLRKEFAEAFGIECPYGMKLKRRLDADKTRGYYEINYPRWQHPRIDGTRDLRFRHNKIKAGDCTLYVENFVIQNNNCILFLEFVRELRMRGATIEETPVEFGRRTVEQLDTSDIQAVTDHYTRFPIEFRNLCAELFQRMGYATALTTTRSAGFDVMLQREGSKGIAWCQCRRLQETVNADVLQRLVDLNQREQADAILVVTTTHFAPDAENFARSVRNQVDIGLIDGMRLSLLLREHNMQYHGVYGKYGFAWEGRLPRDIAEILEKERF